MTARKGGEAALSLQEGVYMGKKSRYTGYSKAVLNQKKEPVRSTQKSILGRLKQLKNQEFVMNVPIGEENGQ